MAYSTTKYLTEEQFTIFEEFMKDSRISKAHIIEIVMKTRAAIDTSFRLRRLERIIANTIVQEKLGEVRELSEKYKDLKF